MNLPLLDVPDDSAAIADWLERQLVGLHLADLVSQLSAVYRADDNTATLAEVLGPNSDQIMQRGLAAAPLETLRELLHSPRLLLELQDRIFVAGGAHWQRVPIDDEQRQVVERQAKALRAKIDGEIMGSHEALQLPPRRTWRRFKWRSAWRSRCHWRSRRSFGSEALRDRRGAGGNPTRLSRELVMASRSQLPAI